ncbi:MAG: LacI family DNA-binding transcriptional regulator [Oscillospiraceae bacterium]
MNISGIAKLAGVSTATVSRVINNVGYVKEETRERVLETMRTAGYVPSNIARSLSKRETPFIGVIVPDIINPFFAELVKAIERAADKQGFKILFFDTDENREKEYAVLSTIKEHWIRGLLITPASCEDKMTGRYLQDLENAGIPVVLLDRDFEGHVFSGVLVDNFEGGYEATKVFLEKGHKNIAIIIGPWEEGPGDGRIKGYFQALRDYGIEPDVKYQAQVDFKMTSGYAACKALMEQPEPPTAIFSCGSTMTFGCIEYFRKHSLEVGEDVAFISFDDILTVNMIERSLSTVGCSLENLGETAFNTLVRRFSERLEDNTQPKQEVLRANVILRGSENHKGFG